MLNSKVLLLANHKFDDVDAEDNFLFGVAILEELIERDVGSVAIEIREDCEDARKELVVG